MNRGSCLTLILIGILWKTGQNLSSLFFNFLLLPPRAWEVLHSSSVSDSGLVALKWKASLGGYGLLKLICHICSQTQWLLKIRAGQIIVTFWPHGEYYHHPSLLPPTPPHESFMNLSRFLQKGCTHALCKTDFSARGAQPQPVHLSYTQKQKQPLGLSWPARIIRVVHGPLPSHVTMHGQPYGWSARGYSCQRPLANPGMGTYVIWLYDVHAANIRRDTVTEYSRHYPLGLHY